MIAQTAHRLVDTARLAWWGAATALIAAGFALDGVSEPGHHAGFILGGVALGLSFKRRR
jgi:hypothetical protein